MNFKDKDLVLLNDNKYIFREVNNIITGNKDYYLYTLDNKLYDKSFKLEDLKKINNDKISINSLLITRDKIDLDVEINRLESLEKSLKFVINNNNKIDIDDDFKNKCNSLYDKVRRTNLFSVNLKDILDKAKKIEEKKQELKSKKEYLKVVLNNNIDNDKWFQEEIISLENEIILLEASIISLKKIIDEE